MSILQIPRRGMMGSAGGSIDVICGTATAVGNTLTMPIPSGYYYYVYLMSEREIVDGDLQAVLATPRSGLYRNKVIPALGNMERLSSDPFVSAFWISHSGDNMIFSCSNRNTSGVIYDGDEWFYIAWKEAD